MVLYFFLVLFVSEMFLLLVMFKAFKTFFLKLISKLFSKRIKHQLLIQLENDYKQSETVYNPHNPFIKFKNS